MRYWVVVILAFVCFGAGAWLVPALRSPDAGRSVEPRVPEARAQLDQQLIQTLSRVDARLQALEVRVATIGARPAATTSAEADAASTSDSERQAALSDERAARLEAEEETIRNAPPARELLRSALRTGALTHDELRAFHRRLDDLPLEQRPALLQEFQIAVNDGKIHILR
jgi:hypothetical protein